jgi:hypothetical protein
VGRLPGPPLKESVMQSRVKKDDHL